MFVGLRGPFFGGDRLTQQKWTRDFVALLNGVTKDQFQLRILLGAS
jgi:hypothetical protein